MFYINNVPGRAKTISRFSFVLALLAISAVFFAGEGKAYAKDGQVEETPDPCLGLLAILDRPTVSDSACAAPLGHAVFELGFQHADLRGSGGGTADNYPQAELRMGLPGRNEFKVLSPNYNSQSTPDGSSSGLSAASVGFKHEVGHNRNWLGSVEAILTMPSGNAAFGSRGLGAAVNGIVNYALNDEIGLSLLLGISSQTTSKLSGGDRFTSFNSDFVATWQPTERLQFYGEVFGQTSSGPGQGAGYNLDGGLQYMVTHWWEVDLEEGVRLTGNLGGFAHYYGVGSGFLF
ncbi:MAG: hypothetical protein M0Z61_01955 [Nitrospiraceae bacterium]|nr:hypothetical protein [Nitrospiraceae bacterium]